MVAFDEICVAVQAEEDQIGQISAGVSAALTYSCYEEERLISGTVIETFNDAQDGIYTAYVDSEDMPAQLGRTAEVRID